jgi:hypothetical protein
VTQGEGTCAKDFVPPESLSVRSYSGIIISGYTKARLTIQGDLLAAYFEDPSLKILQSTIYDIKGRKVCAVMWNINGICAGNSASRGKIRNQTSIGKVLPRGIYFVKSFFSNGLSASQKLEVVGNE